MELYFIRHGQSQLGPLGKRRRTRRGQSAVAGGGPACGAAGAARGGFGRLRS